MGYGIVHSASAEARRFQVVQKRALRGQKIVPIAEWPTDDSRVGGGIGLLLFWRDQDVATADADSVSVPHVRLAELSDGDAANLGLPPLAPYALELRSTGRVDQSSFSVRAEWLRDGNFPVAIERQGVIARSANGTFRIANPLFDLVTAVDAFREANTSDVDDRLAAWEPIQTALSRITGPGLRTEDYLRTLVFYHAGAFSLSVEHTPDGLEFSPVLFKRDVVGEEIERPEDEAAENEFKLDHPDEKADALLPHDLQEIFVRDRYTPDRSCASAYPLGRNTYVVLDDKLRAALNVTKMFQKADRDARERFIRNPRVAIQESLGDDAEGVAVLFIETAQYAERVQGLDLWQKPVLPWLQCEPNTWVPEKFGLRVGESVLTLDENDLRTLKLAYDDAKASGRSEFDFKGTEVPVNEQTGTAIRDIETVIRPSEVGQDEPGRVEDDLTTSDVRERIGKTYALQIITNFENEEAVSRRQPRFTRIALDPPKADARSSLMPHQWEGFDWLLKCWLAGRPGVLLADDMGLGKTFQTLMFLRWLRNNMVAGLAGSTPRGGAPVLTGPILIVAPTSLLHNWMQEADDHLAGDGLGHCLEAFGSRLRNLKHDDHTMRDTALGRASLKVPDLRAADWILTTYETLANYHLSFAQIRFSAVIFDEIQKIKSPDTINTHAAKTLNIDFAIGLTGTPVENRLSDLWSIVDRLEPGFLGDLKTFSQTYKENDEEALKALRELVAENERPTQLMLRRMKSEIKIGDGLPEKNEQECRAVMPDVQATAYTDLIAAAKNAGGGPGHMLKTLQGIRGCSLHPLSPETVLGDTNKYESYIAQSARLAEVVSLLGEIDRAGEKALLFIEHRKMQEFISHYIHWKFDLDHYPGIINGAVPPASRKRKVDEFQDRRRGFDALILSPRAAGVGLTITAANHVIHVSRWWNPAVEDQCNDRAYRIGQTKPVTVYYPIAEHPNFGEASFDIILNNLLSRKRALSRDMLMPAESERDVEDIFNSTMGNTVHDDVLGYVDNLDPIGFEDWCRSELKRWGYETYATPTTGDGGADGILKHNHTGEYVVLQCKHLRSYTVCSDEAVKDTLRARERYNLVGARLAVLTTAQKFSKKAETLAHKEKVELFARASLPNWAPDFSRR